MELADILTADQILTDLKATNRWEAIDELVQHLVDRGKIKPDHRDQVIAAVKKREAAMSTGIGFGVGLPHASTNLIDEAIGVMGRSKNGIDFAALDNKPVKIVLLFLVPQGQFQKHLHTLANIAKLMHQEDFLTALENAPDAEAMLQIIKSYGKK